MQISAEWATAAITVAGLAGTWFGGWRERRKAALPLVTWDGHRLEIINRINEHLEITAIDCNGMLNFGDYERDWGGSIIPGTEAKIAPPFALKWRIPALQTATFVVVVFDAPEPAEIRFAISSSLKTLSSKRYRLRESQSD